VHAGGSPAANGVRVCHSILDNSGPPRYQSGMSASTRSVARCRQKFRPAFVIAGLLRSAASLAVADLGEVWEWRNPLPQGSGLKALAESNGRLIAVGRAGTILTTTDGMNWMPRVSGTRSFLRAVAASGTTVVAVGREKDIVTSFDGGLTWPVRVQGIAEWETVVHGGGLWVAVGNDLLMTSADGILWTTVTIASAVEAELNCLLWTGSRFVLGGSDGDNGVVWTSEDGNTWTPRATGLRDVRGLARSGSQIVAVGTAPGFLVEGDIFTSPDGITWTDALTPDRTPSLDEVMWAGTQFLAWSRGRSPIYTSPTGESWTERFLSPSPYGTFFPAAAVVAGNALIFAGDSGVMFHSPDGGSTWNAVQSGVRGNFNAVTHFAGRWIAVGGDGILTSSADGTTWTPASSGVIDRLRALAWHDGQWVAGAYFTSTDGVTWIDSPHRAGLYSVIRAGSQWVGTSRNAVWTSPDGNTWTARGVGGENRAVAWNGSRLVVAGGVEDGSKSIGRIEISDNGGVSWSTQTIGNRFLRGIVWTGTQFVFVGDAGTIFTSPTGTAGSWTQRSSGTYFDLRGVMADGGGLVAVGGNYSTGSVVLTSPDGVTWTPRPVPTTNLLYSVIKAGELYVATGYDGVVLTSPDAVTWVVHQTPTTHELYAAAWDGRQLLVAGEGGAILASTDSSRPVAWKSIVSVDGPTPAFRLTWPAITGRVYDIESTTTLTPPWLPIPGSPRTATGAEEFIDFTESGPSAALRRFFRVRERR
jgi:hypothetical protein